VPHWLCSLLHWLSLHWGDVVPAWLAVLVAAFFGYLSWRASRRSKDAANAAKVQADRATTAAEDAIRAQQEIAGETRRIADTMQESSNAAEQKPWRIVKGSSGGHRLINTTATPKYHVSLRGSPVRVDERNRFRVVDGNSARTIFLLEHWWTLPSWTITVSWHVTQDQSSPALRQEIEAEK
jgi:hypothetical protein